MKSLPLKIDRRMFSFLWLFVGSIMNAPTKNQTLIPNILGAIIILMSW